MKRRTLAWLGALALAAGALAASLTNVSERVTELGAEVQQVIGLMELPVQLLFAPPKRSS
jgi:hypothetical protein